MDFLQTWQGLLWTLYCLSTGLVLGWVWASAPLKRKIEYLQSAPMERILKIEEWNRSLVEENQWAQAKVQALESDLARMNQKLSGSGLELPQHRGMYWKMEFEKSQARVLELEFQLESLRSKTLWKE